MIFLSKNLCQINNFTQIKYIKSSEILISCKIDTIVIKGENLHLSYFSKDELTIEGRIESVNFND